MQIRSSEAQWDGTLRDGKGRFWTESGEVSGVFSHSTRFEDDEGTNPEELIGAAIAGCFSMALAGDLEKSGHRPESVRTVAAVRIEKGERGFSISGIDLDTSTRVDGIDGHEFTALAEQTAVNCPVGKALAAVPIRIQARLTA
jgi:osmotically inducible protein OsmC